MGKKNAIPKKVAGYRIPKSLRKSRLLKHLLKSKVGREILANALTAGATAAAAALVSYREDIANSTVTGAKRGKRALAALSEAIHEGTNAMMGVVADAARSVTDDGGRDDRRPGGRQPAPARH